jgi:hypothetical protein
MVETDPNQISTMSNSPPRATALGNFWSLLLVGIVAAAPCLPFLRTILNFGYSDEGCSCIGLQGIRSEEPVHSE